MSCTTNSPNINNTFIIEPSDGSTPTFSACTGFYTNLIADCTDGQVKLDSNLMLVGDLYPEDDGVSDIGTTSKRFRNLNTINGNATKFSATQEIITPILDLGLDTNNLIRKITANNSIIKDDTLLGGTY